MTRPSTATDAVPDPPSVTAGWRWDLARLLFGIVYVLGAAAHVALGATAPGVYERFADLAVVGAYTDLWHALVVPNLTFLQPLVIVFELTVGIALLWRGRAVRFGHAGGAIFQLALVPSGPWGLINALLALVHLAALRVSYPTSIGHRVRRQT